MPETLVVNEIYLSIQGESTFAGLPCVFIRLTGCPLRCSYCDTAYAFTQGKRHEIASIVAKVNDLAVPYAVTSRNSTQRLPLVELTGGEPLAQKNARKLIETLCEQGFTVLIETSGALDISGMHPTARRIMDLKCPSSGEVQSNRWENLNDLRPTDEIKFVIATREDYKWTKEQIVRHKLDSICPVLCSWGHPLVPEQQNPSLNAVPAGQTPISRRELVEKIIADKLPVRFQAQLHKLVWPAEQRGV